LRRRPDANGKATVDLNSIADHSKLSAER